MCYLKGVGIEADKNKAIEMLTKLTEKKYPPSMTQLSAFNMKDKSKVWGGAELAKALEVWHKGAEHKDGLSCFELGRRLVEGEDSLPKDKEEGLELLITVVENRNERRRNF